MQDGKEIHMNSIYDYWKEHMKVSAHPGLRDFPLDTHCGRESIKIIDKTNELLAMCDTHPKVVNNIKLGALTAIEIVCFG